MNQEKIDYPPLLPGGLHPHTLESLRELTVDAFPESIRRRALFSALGVYLDMLGATGFKGTAWIDGSFMCAKDEPDDIDIVLVFKSSVLDEISESARPVLMNLFDSTMVMNRFRLHVFQVAEENSRGVAYWQQQFGTQRDEVTPKGLASIGVNI